MVSLVSVSLAASAAHAQDTSVSGLRAAFVFNFTRFATWPSASLPAGRPIHLCLRDRTGVADALRTLVKGRTVGNRTLEVRQLSPADDPNACHVLYLSSDDPGALSALAALGRNATVLTIGDARTFAEAGAIAGLFTERDQMRFAVNLGVLRRSGLQLNSNLLSLAVIVDK